MQLERTQSDPLLALTAQDLVDDLEATLRQLLTGVNYPGVMTNVLGMTMAQAQHLMTEYPKLIAGLRILGHTTQPVANQQIRNLLYRIHDRTQPDGFGCLRWFGSTQGAHPSRFQGIGDGGTPVISYEGKTVPARRLLWQIKFPAGHPEHLKDDERLRKNPECLVGSRCMNLTHWHKGVPEKTVRTDRALARDIQKRLQARDPSLTGTVLATHPELLTTSRVCRNGHLIDAGGGPGQRQGHRDCPICRRQAPSRKMAARAAVQKRQQTQHALPEPQMPAWWPDVETVRQASAQQITEWFERLERERAPTTHVAAPQAHPAAIEAPSTPPWPREWADEPEETIPPETVLSLLMPKSKRE